MDIQKLLDLMSSASRSARSNYHMTLGEAIEVLRSCEPSLPLHDEAGNTIGRLRSYRGYYSDLAFEPEGSLATVAAVLADCEKALGSTFEGYKGGDNLMGPETPLWLSAWGSCSDLAVTAIELKADGAVLLTRDVG